MSVRKSSSCFWLHCQSCQVTLDDLDPEDQTFWIGECGHTFCGGCISTSTEADLCQFCRQGSRFRAQPIFEAGNRVTSSSLSPSTFENVGKILKSSWRAFNFQGEQLQRQVNALSIRGVNLQNEVNGLTVQVERNDEHIASLRSKVKEAEERRSRSRERQQRSRSQRSLFLGRPGSPAGSTRPGSRRMLYQGEEDVRPLASSTRIGHNETHRSLGRPRPFLNGSVTSGYVTRKAGSTSSARNANETVFNGSLSTSVKNILEDTNAIAGVGLHR